MKYAGKVLSTWPYHLQRLFGTFLKHILQTVIPQLLSHGFPAFDQELKTQNKKPDSWCTLTQKGLLCIVWLPESISDMSKLIPISWSQMEVSVAALLSEARHSFACISKENQLINGLIRSKITVTGTPM